MKKFARLFVAPGYGNFNLIAALIILIFLMGMPYQTPASAARSAQSASDPVIAAAGDIACDPANAVFNNGNGDPNACRQKATSDLLVNSNLSAVLDLGDNQYFCGSYQAFLQSYDLSWGRVKSITHPVLGNHELLTTGDIPPKPSTDCTSANAKAAGYWNYFGTAGGDPSLDQGYYSFDIGAWHIIALDSDCGNAGGCSPNSLEYKWLQNNLAANTSSCILAYWHVPLFSSGGQATQATLPFWMLLYNNGADIVLNGHDHIYERFAPQDPSGAADSIHGIREFIVGTGGADHTLIGPLAANSEVQNADTYGVLKLTLHSKSADWQFVPEAGKTFTDSGTTVCHAIDKIPPTAPTNLTVTSVSAGQADLAWTASTDNIGVTGYGIYRNGIQIGTSAGTSYSDSSLQANMGYSYYVVAFDAASHVSAASNTATIPTPQTSIVFSDGFESGNLSQWTLVQGLVVQQQEVFAGNYAARGTSSAGAATYVRKQLAAPQSDLYYRIRFKSISQGTNNMSLLKFRTAADASILSLGINNLGQLSYHNDLTGSSVNSTTIVTKGSWQTLQVHVKIAGSASQIEVWYNDALVSAMTRTDAFGINPIGRLQLGENTPGLTYDVAFDDISAALGFIVDSSPAPTPTFTPTFTPTSIPTATSTPTDTPTSTLTPTDTPTATFTPTSTSTSTPIPTPTFTATPTATMQSSVVFSDGFESGDLSQWTLVQGLVVQQQEVFAGNYAARGTSSGGAATYARKMLSAPQTDLYYRIRFKVVSQAANTVNLMKFRTATDASILSMSINNVGALSYRNDIAGTSINSSVVVSKGNWQSLQVHINIANTNSLVEVWYNDVLIITRTEALGTTPIQRLQLGENTSGATYDIAFDDVSAALVSLAAPTPTPTFTPTVTSTITSTSSPTNTPASTLTPTATLSPTVPPTSTLTPTVTISSTNTPTSTSIPTATSTFTASPTATTAQSSVVFSDGFESGDLSLWTLVQGLVVQQQEVASGNYAARGTSNAGAATYARKLLTSPQSDLYYRIRFKVISQAANTVNLMKFRTATDVSILSVSINNGGALSYHNDIAGTSFNSVVVVGKGSWQSLQVHVNIANTNSLVEVWYNDALVITRTEALGTTPIQRLQLGENTSGATYDIAFDDVTAATGFIVAPTPTPTLTPTNTLPPPPSPSSTATSTQVPTATTAANPTSTPTLPISATPTPTDTPTSPPAATDTSSPAPTPTDTPTSSATAGP